jgi:hypothetical protein
LRVKYRICAWLAILAMALNALWPLIVTAQPKSIPNDICSASGTMAMGHADAGHDMLPAPPAH